MSSPLRAARLQEALEHERFTSSARTVVPDLNLSALEQQFFVEWEVPQPLEPRDGAVSAG